MNRAAALLLLLLPCSVHGKAVDRDFQELKRIQESNAKVLADTNLAVDQLRQEVQQLRGLVEEARYFFQQESDKNGRLLRDFDFRLTGIEERLGLHQHQLEELFRKPSGKKGAKETEEGEYKRALAEINLGNFQAAAKQFEDFLKKYPQSTLSDNAQYWRAEALYAVKDFTGALVEFQKVVKNFPQSDKVPGALLKQGYCLYERQALDDSRIFLEKVVKDFPKSDEAAEARERLKKIEALKLAPVVAPAVPAPAPASAPAR